MGRDRRRIQIVGDRRRAGVADGVQRHRAFLESVTEVVGVDLEERADLARLSADLVLVFGGDGSILHVARRLGRNPIPILGVNYGRFGFLADLAPDDLESGIRRWLADDFHLSERARLSVRLGPDEDGDEVLEVMAFNDVVVGRDGVGRMLDCEVAIDGRHAVSYSGDGLILATATGSTAHAMAAGGPLLHPRVAGIVMAPIAPHSLGTRPLVVSLEHVLEIQLSSDRRGPGAVSIDGQPAVPLAPGMRLEVRDARAPVHLMRVSGRPFFDALRSRLGWRGRPDYRRSDPDSSPRP